MSVLCVAAHPDDEVLGVGGTLARHAADGDEVHACLLSDGVTSRHDEVTEEVQERIERRRSMAETACERLGLTSTTFHSFPDNQFDTVPLLEIVQAIEREIEACNPSVVYTHHYGDLNIDHEIVCRATITATRPLSNSGVDRVLAFETPSATEWSVPSPDNAFQPRQFVNIEDYLETKVDALAAYETELRDPPHPRAVDNIRRQARVWGSRTGVPAVEPFDVLREIRR